MSQVPSVVEAKKSLSKKSKVMIVVAIILAGTTIGVFGAHELTLNSSLSPSNMILTSGEIGTVMHNSSRWDVAFLPSDNNIASADYTNASPVPPFGGNVTSPNIILAIIENSSNRSALSGYHYLKSHLLAVISSGVAVGKLTNISFANYSGDYFGFFNSTKSIGAIVATEANYIIVVIVYNLGLGDLTHLFKLQVDKIIKVAGYDSSHFVI